MAKQHYKRRDEIVTELEELKSRKCKTCTWYKNVPIFDLEDLHWTCTEPQVGKYTSCPPETHGCNTWEKRND